MTLTGLDLLAQGGFAEIRGRSVGLLCNQASVTRDLVHAVDLLLPGHARGDFVLKAVFGPQHGLHGHTQDNMIEWEGSSDERTGIPIYSLYGEAREPTDAMLEVIDLFVIDLQDLGARYYTFIWSMALCMKACERRGIPMLVLDRPNPIGGVQVEGPVLVPTLASFVGLHPLPTRHGMTISEVAKYFRAAFYPGVQLSYLTLQGWSRSDYFDDLDLRWIPPSPNVPVVDSAVVYPGMCLLEGTNLSEGRGTTRPFETFGAPWLDGWKLAAALNGLKLMGAHFRPVQFQPTFNKFSGEVCSGCFLHVTDRRSFEPVLAAIAVLRLCNSMSGGRFEWKKPPYEYEEEKRPIDILFGRPDLAEVALEDTPLNQVHQMLVEDAAAFEPARKAALLYATA